MLAFAAPTAPAQPVVEARIDVVPSAPVRLVDRPPVGDWGWRLMTVVLGPVADRNPDVALTILRTADELADTGHAWVQRLTRRPVLG
ncbi:hypothetical protein SAMN05660199_01728 [Klenkia soli]|uniref:Uncharacterized protein n=2 Tax=Klenkia soli TaxID=1052260 RepID=A0A1H0IQ42_9ACTN|nr:hypothetical protein SAMN05660199_01728 [Klenkia soli]